VEVWVPGEVIGQLPVDFVVPAGAAPQWRWTLNNELVMIVWMMMIIIIISRISERQYSRF